MKKKIVELPPKKKDGSALKNTHTRKNQKERKERKRSIRAMVSSYMLCVNQNSNVLAHAQFICY